MTFNKTKIYNLIFKSFLIQLAVLFVVLVFHSYFDLTKIISDIINQFSFIANIKFGQISNVVLYKVIVNAIMFILLHFCFFALIYIAFKLITFFSRLNANKQAVVINKKNVFNLQKQNDKFLFGEFYLTNKKFLA